MKQLTLTALLFVASASFAQATTVNGFTSFIALGDSLTDDGKLGALPPPSDGGRFSNGPTFAENLASDFENAGLVDFNFAVGGATAEDDNENPIALIPQLTPISTFAGQVATLGGALAAGASAVIGDTPLVSVLFGANDIFQDLGEGSFIGEIGQQAALAVENGIRSVGALDARLNNFLLINLPDFAELPAFNGMPTEDIASIESMTFNQQLSLSAQALRDDGFNVIEFDLDAFFVMAQANLGLDNAACRPSFAIPGPSCEDLGGNADDFFFADSVHPNRIVHAAAAEAIREQLTPVPLPAGMPLVLTGVALLGLASRRRNKARA